ncbi:Abi family protein [Corynebacterium sp.]|uniref:Abi family protein n=1 Tax=Corynebacterium sp. TaxID=1720 RepID=UPI0026DCCBA2|nr:Abi family protein [Corynebacterium sp.]MDO4914732.1 Abi family protein [Corynebacterium sp.]
MTYNNLEQWFSCPRMRTYAHHRDPEAFYVWNTQLSKTFLEDIAHVEVLLRNRIDTAVSPRYGAQWYDHEDINLSTPARRAVWKAKKRISNKQRSAPLPGQVIAELSLDFWVFLFGTRYQSRLWPLIQAKLVTTLLPSDNDSRPRVSPSLEDFKTEIDEVYRLRNRCAHHEPLVKQHQEEESADLDRYEIAIKNVSNWIDPVACQWITQHSRVADIRLSRP